MPHSGALARARDVEDERLGDGVRRRVHSARHVTEESFRPTRGESHSVSPPFRNGAARRGAAHGVSCARRTRELALFTPRGETAPVDDCVPVFVSFRFLPRRIVVATLSIGLFVPLRSPRSRCK